MYYQELEVWKKSIELVKTIYQVTEKFPQKEQFGLVSQIRRAIVSIPSNIAEGSARYSNRDTARFADIAIGSLAEVETQLIIAKELNYISNISSVTDLLKNVYALLIGYRNYLNNDKNLTT